LIAVRLRRTVTLALAWFGLACGDTKSVAPDADATVDADAAGEVAAAPAQRFDLGADFSAAANPNGPWRYGHTRIRSLAGKDFALDPIVITGGPVPFWHPGADAAGYYPYVAGNGGGATVIDATGSWALRAHEVAMEGSLAGQYSVVQFLTPRSGRYRIDAAFSGVHARLSSTDVHVLRGDAALFDATIDGYGGDPTFHEIVGSSPNAHFAATLELHENEVLSFAVGYGANQTHYNDTTGLLLQITSPP
jgi:hypothetical protein